MEPILKIGLLFTLLLSGISGGSPASASEIVSPLDAQHFEQAYEDWTKKIIHDLNPKLRFTVLTHVEFSRNPEQLQAYEDMKVENHLPGLPEVMDQNYSNPLESPLYALVAKKSFKIISYGTLSTQELSILKEVLNNKLRLQSSDTLHFEVIATKAEESLQFKHNSRNEFALLFGLLLIAGSIYSIRRKRKTSNQPKDAKPKESILEKTTIPSPPVENPTLTGSHQIQMAPIETLRRALESEKPDLIARACLNTSKRFNHYLIGECSQEKMDQVVQWTLRNQKSVSLQDSNYARLLLAAKLQQIQNALVVNSIDAFHHARTLKINLKKTYTAVQSPEVKEANL